MVNLGYGKQLNSTEIINTYLELQIKFQLSFSIKQKLESFRILVLL